MLIDHATKTMISKKMQFHEFAFVLQNVENEERKTKKPKKQKNYFIFLLILMTSSVCLNNMGDEY